MFAAVIQFISKIIRNISLRQVGIWCGAVFLSIVLYTTYENRNRITSLVYKKPKVTNNVGMTFSITTDTELIAKQMVLADEAIVGISIMSADLRLNEANTLYAFADDEELSSVNDNARLWYSTRVALFTNIDENNDDVIRLINGQFSCSKFSTTLLSKVHTNLNTRVKMVCRSSIPSYYGYFSGYVTLYLGQYVSQEKIDQLRVATDKLATDIYFRDVVNTQHIETIKKTGGPSRMKIFGKQ
jgi:hypothetical protein